MPQPVPEEKANSKSEIFKTLISKTFFWRTSVQGHLQFPVHKLVTWVLNEQSAASEMVWVTFSLRNQHHTQTDTQYS